MSSMKGDNINNNNNYRTIASPLHKEEIKLIRKGIFFLNMMSVI